MNPRRRRHNRHARKRRGPWTVARLATYSNVFPAVPITAERLIAAIDEIRRGPPPVFRYEYRIVPSPRFLGIYPRVKPE